MGKFKFLNHLDTMIDWYNQGKSYAEIARLLKPITNSKRNIESDAGNVRRLLRRHLGDIKGHPKIVIDEDVKQKIDFYLKEGKTPKQISSILNIKYPTVAGYLRSLNLKFRPDCGNIHYFETVDTYAKAYILGFIAADGAIVVAKNGKIKTLTITVKYEDKDVLEFIKSEIGNTHKLLEIKRPCAFTRSKTIHHIRLAMSVPQLVNDIMKYGIEPRKSLTMGNIIENIPFEFRDAFIIGYFDGDGSVHINDGLRLNSRGIMCKDYSLYISFRGTTPFLKGVCNHLGITETHVRKYCSISTLSFANKKDVCRLFKCYNNLPFYYKRKYDRFLRKINHPSFDKYKQVQTISSSTE